MTTLTADSVLRLRPLTMTPQAGSVIVGRADIGRFVALPPIGAQAVELLHQGLSIAAVEAAVTPPDATEPVDVLGFATSLVGLDFVESVDLVATRSEEARRGPGLVVAPGPHARWLFSRTGAALAALAGLAAVVLMIAVPSSRPHPLDAFFLSTPAESLAALTVLTYALAGLHELAHVMAAAALGVPARLRITRRLYFLTFETNLTGLWALPPRRRLGPLLAGMAFDAVVLFALLVLRVTGTGPDRLVAALVLVEVSALVVQLFVFLRSDVYAVMTALLGCTNLAQTTRLLLRRSLRRLSPAQAADLAAMPERDVAVARWYRFVHVAGLAVAAWFFVAFFVPTTLHLLVWMRDALVEAGPTHVAFYQALVLGVLLLSPRAITGLVALRDLVQSRRLKVEPS
ncbi:hypothetical protein [Cellulomonas sp. URHD0024]|uniref:hypothetical protein n=1 Tax=Cellulomonas sp. URHD0024 TaxID=1302620 RepID=UPI0003FC7996|nr:hypothetical protein [Cellulomonas sp. URHD0024]